LLRHFLEAQRYFADRFGRAPTVAFAADSFGHSAGIPEILAAAGMDAFVFGRPLDDVLPLARPAFLWEAASGRRILACRVPVWWYGTERDEIPRRMDASLQAAERFGMDTIGVFIGLGNHGGGPTRRHLRELREWAALHPGVEVRFSTLHAFIKALRQEASLPVIRGELNCIMRGCYVSAARLKTAYRRAEAALTRVETLDACVAALLGRRPVDLGCAWRALLFNSFHDILPGSSIERAYDEALDWIGAARHAVRRAEVGALDALAHAVDTSVPSVEGDRPGASAVLAFNPHPWRYRGPLDIEAALDYRMVKREDEPPVALDGPDGEAVPCQVVAQESAVAISTHSWRRRVAFRADIPALGWAVYRIAWRPGAVNPMAPGRPCTGAAGRIDNGAFSVQARPGDGGIAVMGRSGALLGEAGLHAVTVDDAGGSWGSPCRNHSAVLHRWSVSSVQLAEGGPERAMLRIRMLGGDSRLDLDVTLWRERAAVDVEARLLWTERAARVKLVLPVPGGADTATFEVPGGAICRGAMGEVPGGRWVRVHGASGELGFASDSLYGFDLTDGALRVSVVRGSRYADDTDADDGSRPAMDQGEHRFRFLMSAGGEELETLAAELERPPVALLVAPHKAILPGAGSIASLEPSSVRMLALKPAADGRDFVVRLQETSGLGCSPTLRWLDQDIALGDLPAWEIVTWRLLRKGRRWRAERSDAVERPVSNRPGESREAVRRTS
ncbi:MAG TPA: glycoside hydrolase family 38 C-terminal domain-containing protein, partial [Spirochaetia bacterium]|nr:glycoside hydrolase family 38 C-terminal domain-containing protein [Spirochaetia bacterium]